MTARKSTAIAVLAVCLSSVGFAQGRRAGGLGLTLFADRNFNGRSATLRTDTPNFEAIGMNDIVSSLRVGAGEYWEVCENANYQGRCLVVSGAEPNLESRQWNDTISSARRVGPGSSSGGVGTPAEPGPPAAVGRLTLFSREQFGGSKREFTEAHPDLRQVDFNDIARSLRLTGGGTWEVCVNANYVDCKVVKGNVADLREIGVFQRVSSVRPWSPPGTGPVENYLVLYDDTGFRGPTFRVNAAAPQLSGFANRAQSVHVRGEGAWELCEQASFGGRCVVVTEQIEDLASVGLSNRVMSARPIPTARRR